MVISPTIREFNDIARAPEDIRLAWDNLLVLDEHAGDYQGPETSETGPETSTAGGDPLFNAIQRTPEELMHVLRARYEDNGSVIGARDPNEETEEQKQRRHAIQMAIISSTLWSGLPEIIQHQCRHLSEFLAGKLIELKSERAEVAGLLRDAKERVTRHAARVTELEGTVRETEIILENQREQVEEAEQDVRETHEVTVSAQQDLAQTTQQLQTAEAEAGIIEENVLRDNQGRQIFYDEEAWFSKYYVIGEGGEREYLSPLEQVRYGVTNGVLGMGNTGEQVQAANERVEDLECAYEEGQCTLRDAQAAEQAARQRLEGLRSEVRETETFLENTQAELARERQLLVDARNDVANYEDRLAEIDRRIAETENYIQEFEQRLRDPEFRQGLQNGTNNFSDILGDMPEHLREDFNRSHMEEFGHTHDFDSSSDHDHEHTAPRVQTMSYSSADGQGLQGPLVNRSFAAAVANNTGVPLDNPGLGTGQQPLPPEQQPQVMQPVPA